MMVKQVESSTEPTLKDLAEAYNLLAANYEGFDKVQKFTKRPAAEKKLDEALHETGEKLIKLVNKEVVKRGKAAKMHSAYADGWMLLSDFVKKVEKKDDCNRHDAMRAVRYDSERGYIWLLEAERGRE